MAADVVLLTGLLFFTGGPFNPFSFLYLVHIALAAVVLRARGPGRWSGCRWSASGRAVLRPRVARSSTNPARTATSNTCACTCRACGSRSGWPPASSSTSSPGCAARWRSASGSWPRRAHAARSERLASLATLAAGAAHELATPLGTIAVAARSSSATERQGPRPAREDVRLIRAQVDRCRAILDQWRPTPAEPTGESFARRRCPTMVRAGAATSLPPEPRLAGRACRRGGGAVRDGAARGRPGAARGDQERARTPPAPASRPWSAPLIRAAPAARDRGTPTAAPGMSPGGAGARGRAVLHHQAAGQGHGPGPLPGARGGRAAGGALELDLVGPGRGTTRHASRLPAEREDRS